MTADMEANMQDLAVQDTPEPSADDSPEEDLPASADATPEKGQSETVKVHVLLARVD